MSLAFEQAMILTRTVSSHAAFEDEECRAYFDILTSLPSDALIIEVGLEYGRSSSIALQVAHDKQLRYIGIDPMTTEHQIPWLRMAQAIGHRFEVFHYKSDQVDCDGFNITAILIDGDHGEVAVYGDCCHFLPHIVTGGYALLHDYGRDSLPGVIVAADRYFGERPDWEQLPTVGTLGIWKKR